MASFDVKHASADTITKFEVIKTDKEFQNWVVTDSKGELLLDLCEYIDYIPPLADQMKEYRELDSQVKNIENDAKRRKIVLDAQKLKQQYNTESQNDVHNLEAFLKEFESRMNELDNKLGDIEQSKDMVPDNLNDKMRAATEPVPDSLYRN